MPMHNLNNVGGVRVICDGHLDFYFQIREIDRFGIAVDDIPDGFFNNANRLFFRYVFSHSSSPSISRFLLEKHHHAE